MSIYDQFHNALAQQSNHQMDYYNAIMRQAQQQSQSLISTNGTGTVSQPTQSTRAFLHNNEAQKEQPTPKPSKKLLLLKR